MTERLVTAARRLDPEVADLFEWEVTLVRRDDLVNAWCLPGGKMAIYTGILPVADDGTGDFETGLAVVMGHEIAHATLRHGTRAMTRQMGFSAMIALIGAALGDGDEAALAAMAAQFAANFVTLSFGRDAELEADRRGFDLHGDRGVRPSGSRRRFWRRMKAATGGDTQPEWLSTHPSNDNRIAQIESLLEVIPIYEQSRGSR